MDGAAAQTLTRATDSAVRKALVIGAERSFEQDAGFGLIVLSEIAQRLRPRNSRCSPTRGAGGIAYEAIARCSMSQLDVMPQWLRHLAALIANAPPVVQAAAIQLVQRVLARAARSGADSEDMANWQVTATSLGLVPGLGRG